MAKIQVGLSSIVCYEDFSMLNRVHSSGVNVEIRIELLRFHLVPAAFEKPSEARRDDPLSEPRNNAARYEHILCHFFILRFLFLCGSAFFAAFGRDFAPRNGKKQRKKSVFF